MSELSAIPTVASHADARSATRRRYAFVGTGGRVRMFLDPVVQRFAAAAEIVGLCDSSLVRARFHQTRLTELGYALVPVYAADQFGAMLQDLHPDVVVVCTIDREHDRYIVEALRAGCDVITEKPMTTTADRCARIFSAVEETGRRVRVAFNYRWGPGPSKVRELLASGTIGAVRHVTMEYLLNTSHGADYFRRWHASKENSGGLLVHKSTHHFDLINWWIDAIPEHVFAHGSLAFYGQENAIRRGDEALTKYPRYFGHSARTDPFNYDYTHSMLQDPEAEKRLYLAAEKESSYVRDQNVFRPGITIEDTMNVLVRYRTGALLNYSLNAFSPYEGFRVAFTGDKGRIEYREWHGAHYFDATKPESKIVPGPDSELMVMPLFKAPYRVQIDHFEGGHGGADPLLQEHIFSPQPPADPLRRGAGHEQGAASILVGIAANQSMVERREVCVSDLLSVRSEAKKLSELT
jgi:predicted dehydrogenase